MAKKSANSMSKVEMYFMENNRNLSDEEMGLIFNQSSEEVAEKRKALSLSYEKKEIKPTDLKFNPTLQQWEDDNGNIYNGPPVKSEDVKETVDIKRQVAAGVKAGDLIARNDKNTVAIMTAGASQMSDLVNTKQRLIPTCVHQPKRRR